MQARFECIRDIVLPDENYDSLYDTIDKIGTMVELQKHGLLTMGQYVFVVLEWFRGGMLNGGFEQTLGNQGWLLDDILECLICVEARNLAHNFEGMLAHVETDLTEFESVPGDGKNAEWRKASKKFDAQVRLKLGATPEGLFLQKTTNWCPTLEAKLLRYFERNFSDFCFTS